MQVQNEVTFMMPSIVVAKFRVSQIHDWQKKLLLCGSGTTKENDDQKQAIREHRQHWRAPDR
jgi:hypothetical protein